MKRIALRSTAALLTIAALGSTASAQSGYIINWSKSAPTPAASAQKTERASSGYLLSIGKTQPAD